MLKRPPETEGVASGVASSGVSCRFSRGLNGPLGLVLQLF